MAESSEAGAHRLRAAGFAGVKPSAAEAKADCAKASGFAQTGATSPRPQQGVGAASQLRGLITGIGVQSPPVPHGGNEPGISLDQLPGTS